MPKSQMGCKRWCSKTLVLLRVLEDDTETFSLIDPQLDVNLVTQLVSATRLPPSAGGYDLSHSAVFACATAGMTELCAGAFVRRPYGLGAAEPSVE